MKLLLDQNLSFRLAKRLIGHFSECIHVSNCGLSNSEDPEIWQFAKKEGFAIVTFDADFYDISVINGHPPKIIWIRTGNLTTNELAQLLIENRMTIDRFLKNEEYRSVACLELELK